MRHLEQGPCWGELGPADRRRLGAGALAEADRPLVVTERLRDRADRLERHPP
jgi:hypothetical protein